MSFRRLAAPITGFVLIGSLILNAAPLKRPKPANTVEQESQASVEELARRLRPSVVVVSHFGREGKEEGIGAGFVISSNGLVATSLHVIGEARPVTVRLASGREYEVSEVHAWDRNLDLAILRIDASGLQALPLITSLKKLCNHPKLIYDTATAASQAKQGKALSFRDDETGTVEKVAVEKAADTVAVRVKAGMVAA